MPPASNNRCHLDNWSMHCAHLFRHFVDGESGVVVAGDTLSVAIPSGFSLALALLKMENWVAHRSKNTCPN